ncbi:MAG: hypothetical protein IT256_07140 [Chitinophagaceae bacterium]|nr:hypothetical protein [Chitinophagaceae bacterium]
MKKYLMFLLIPFLTGLTAGLLFGNRFIIDKIPVLISTEEWMIISTSVVFLFSAYFTFSTIKPDSPQALLLMYIKFSLGWFIVDFTVRIIEGWQGSFFSLPRFFCQMVAILSAYLLYSKNNVRIICGISIVFLSYFISINYLLPISFNYTNYGVFNQNKITKLPQNWGINYQNRLIDNDDLKSQYFLIDFWNKGCVLCFKKFPLLDSFNKSIKNRAEIKVMAVLIKYKEEDSIAVSHLVNKHYSFPIGIGGAKTRQIFNIVTFPTVVVIHNGQIIYKGSIEGAMKNIPN